jgi:hypothetical protein
MAETILTLSEALDRANAQAQVLNAAVMTLARRKAINVTKEQLRAEGLTRPLPPSDILPLANAYLVAHREELISEAKATVERWRVEGVFGKRAAESVRKVPQLRTLAEPKTQNAEDNRR